MKRKTSIALALIAVMLLATGLAIIAVGCGPEATSPTPNMPPLNPGTSPLPPSQPGGPQLAPPVAVSGLTLTVTQPPDNYISSVNTVEVKGRTSAGAVVSANDQITTADSQGNFAVTVTLNEGPNIIDVVASDEAGRETSVTLVVTFAQ